MILRWRRRLLLRTTALRRSLRPRSRFVPWLRSRLIPRLWTVHVGPILWRPVRLRTCRSGLRSVVRHRIRTVIPCGRFGWTVRCWILSRTIVRRRLIHLRTVVRLCCCRSIVACRWLERTIRFRPVGRRLIRSRLPWCRTIVRRWHSTIIPRRGLSRTIPRLIRRTPVFRLRLSRATRVVRCRHRTRTISGLICSWRRREWPSRRYDLDSRCCGRRGRWRHSCELLPWNRLTWVLRKHLLTSSKRWWRRRRCGLCDDLTICNRGWRSRDATCGTRVRT